MALEPSYLKMSAGAGDEECCQLIQYSPGPLGVAGITFKDNETLDLSNAKRVVFFAMGQRGGETVKFLAAGRASDNSSLNVESPSSILSSNNSSASLPEGIFSDKSFGKITQDVVLEKNWTRYQISLEGLDLREISDPFGFVLTSNNNNGSETSVDFHLKGVTYDTKPATDPLDTLEGNSTLSSSNSTSLPTPSNNTDFTSNSTSLPTPSNNTDFTSNSTSLPTPSNNTDFTSNSTSLPTPSNNTDFTSNSTSLPTPSNNTDFTSPLFLESERNSTSLDTDSNGTIQIQDPDLGGKNENIKTTENSHINNDAGLQDIAQATSNDNNATTSLSLPANNEVSTSSSEPPSSSSLPANLSASNLTIAQPVESGIATTDILTNSHESIPPGSSSFLPLSPLLDPQLPSLLPSEAFRPTFSDTTPPDTVIPLVTDSSTGSAIQNGGISDSESTLSFTFDGLDETSNSIAGYQWQR